MNEASWEKTEGIVADIFLVLIFGIISVFVVGTICRLIAKFSKRNNFFVAFFRKPLVIYTIKRTGSALITIFLVSTATFLLLRLLPDDVYYRDWIIKVPESMKESVIKNVREKYGLDKRVIYQLGEYYKNLLPIPKKVCEVEVLKETIEGSGEYAYHCSKYKTLFINLGDTSVIKRGNPVSSIIITGAAVSFVIGLIASVIEIIIAYPLGILMASKKDKVLDKVGKSYAVLIDAIPTIVYYLLILVTLQRVFKLDVYFDKENMNTWIAPIVALVIAGVPGIAIWVRRYMTDELNSDYVKFAKAKGLPKRRILFVHIFRNAIVPLIRTIPMAIIFSLVGSYFVEVIFSVGGIGSTLINAINKQDNPLVQGLVLVFAFVSTAAYLIGDIATAIADPRVSLTEEE